MARYKIEWKHVLLAAIVLVTLLARLNQVHYNLSGDEIFSITAANQSFAKLISAAVQDRTHPPLYYILLHSWIGMFGASEMAVRSLSIIFSGMLILALYGLLRRFMDRGMVYGLLLLVALSPFFVYLGEEVRPYSLIALAATLNLLSFVRMLERPQSRKAIGIWALSCTLLLYCEYLSVLIILFEVALGFILLRAERRVVLYYGLAGIALFSPWLIPVLVYPVLRGSYAFANITWIARPTFTDFYHFYVSVLGHGPGLRSQNWLLAVLVFLIAAYVVYRFLSHKPFDTRHAILLWVAFGVPLIVYAISIWGPVSIFLSRQLIAAGIAYVVVIGLCLSTLPRTVAAAILLVLVFWAAVSLPQGFPKYMNPPWQNIARQIDTHFGSQTVVTQEYWIQLPLEYYRKPGGRVRPWNQLTQLTGDDGFLFVCRPVDARCSDLTENDALKSHISLVRTWRWGLQSSTWNRLRLYRVSHLSGALLASALQDSVVAPADKTTIGYSGVDLGEGWKLVRWFGCFNTSNSPWIFHQTLGWLYTCATTKEGLWFWHARMKAFLWTRPNVYPYFYRTGDGAWLYYKKGSSHPQWFYNLKAGKWEKY
ncbi:MAG: glycosyltransferase family 39 protein [Syntrophobacteraceae bacterium]